MSVYSVPEMDSLIPYPCGTTSVSKMTTSNNVCLQCSYFSYGAVSLFPADRKNALSPNSVVKAQTNVLEQQAFRLVTSQWYASPPMQVRLNMHLESSSLRLDVLTGGGGLNCAGRSSEKQHLSFKSDLCHCLMVTDGNLR